MSESIFEKRSLNLGEHVPKPGSHFKLNRHIPSSLMRQSALGLPELSELEVVRHFTRLSQKNFCVDTHFYPLGSCTMKYNPKAFDQISTWPFYARIHPYQEEGEVQGMLEIFEETEKALCEMTGMDAFTMQPAAGAHGEMTGLLIVRAYHDLKKSRRSRVLVPDSAHGTNPASAALAGYEVVQIKTNPEGRVDVEDLRAKADSQTACLMLTNPNTLGLFETEIRSISEVIHRQGALMYYDGANINALLGIVRPGDMGFDIVHVNLHKTFAVPHGSGGPGSGPVGVKSFLDKFLPIPRLVRTKKGGLRWNHKKPYSIGRLRSFYGNAGAILRAFCYIKALGREGLRAVAENAILNSNYLKTRLTPYYDLPYKGHCMHEFVLSALRQKEKGVRAMDIAKRLLDFGIHAPTVYFPLIVEEAMMIEPTETESKETLDRFVLTMIEIAREVEDNPKKVTDAPTQTSVKRPDEVLAARQPNLSWQSSA